MLKTLLTLIDQLLRHPLFVTSFSLLIGKLLLDRWSYQKTKRDTKRDKAFEFVEEVANLLNKAISQSFGIIRNEASKLSSDQRLTQNQYISDLFVNKFSIRIKSQAYLNSEKFWHDFECLMIDLRSIDELLHAVKSPHNDVNTIIELARSRRNNLIHKYALRDDDYTENIKSPYDELAAWNSAIFGSADRFLAEALKELL